ncbi:PaREP1 family protein [Pyrofollis japonicus]|uniref:PaREP1 family protein n=1 Tax=Pyrofollis japonicus TaxID=3060460 RepID=UPI00295C051F|nr:PaREP1 family protein [Pyrofollis japonicus]BEP16717.1 PaREP1 family protein [Pyrofollis japonicus]
MAATITLPKRILERIKREAEKQGTGLEEYVVEILVQNLDPETRAQEYIDAAKELLREAYEELERGNIRQAAEKTWGAAALAIKAYASWQDKKRLASHSELWEYAARLGEELGDWVDDAWNQANSMHICFYEGWCKKRHVEAALKHVERLVKTIEEKMQQK